MNEYISRFRDKSVSLTHMNTDTVTLHTIFFLNTTYRD